MILSLSVTRHEQTTQNKFKSLCNISIKTIGNEVEFLPADKHKRLLQDDSITYHTPSQTSPKYQKQLFYNIFAISQGKQEG